MRIIRFRWMSDIRVEGAAVTSRVLAVGAGSVSVAGIQPGFWPSPFLLDGWRCIHLEARSSESSVEIGPGTTINNGAGLLFSPPVGCRRLHDMASDRGGRVTLWGSPPTKHARVRTVSRPIGAMDLDTVIGTMKRAS